MRLVIATNAESHREKPKTKGKTTGIMTLAILGKDGAELERTGYLMYL